MATTSTGKYMRFHSFATLLVLSAASAVSLAEDFPKFPQEAIDFKEVDKVNKGRYATVTLVVNTDGAFSGDYKVENMQALAGCHIGGRLEFYDEKNNLLALVKMPRIGLGAAGFAKRVERHADISGAIKPELVSKLRTIKFIGYEDAGTTLDKDAKEVVDFFKEITVK